MAWEGDRVLFYVDEERIELWETVPNPGYPGFMKLSFSTQKGDIEVEVEVEVEVDQVRIRCQR